MKLIDPITGKIECRICGVKHCANIRSNGGGAYYRVSWQCQHGRRFLDNGKVGNWSTQKEEFLKMELSYGTNDSDGKTTDLMKFIKKNSPKY
jgi:hypothetical protein